MVMVGGVEIAVDLNLEGIEQTLKELEKQFSSTRFGVNVGIDASAYNKLQQDINKVRDRIVVKRICIPIDICEDSINKVERKFYAIKRKLENNPINIKVNLTQKGSVVGNTAGTSVTASLIDIKKEIQDTGKTLVNELKTFKKEMLSGFDRSVSSTNNTTSAIGPIRMMGNVVGELKTIARNTKKQGLISSLVDSAIDGFVMGAMNKSGAKFSENFNKILTRKTSQNIKQTQSKIGQSQSNISQLKEQKRLAGNTEPSYRFDEQIKAEEERIKQLNQELKRLESQLDDSFDFLGGKQLAVKATRLKKAGDFIAKNVFAFKDLKEIKDLSLDVTGTFFNAFTDERFFQEMEDTYVDYMQQVEILGKDAKEEQEKAIKRLTGRFDRVTERTRARAVGGLLKSVAQPFRLKKRVELARSVEIIKNQMPFMENVTGEKKKAIEDSDGVIVFMGGVQPGASQPGQPAVGSTYLVGNALAGKMPKTYVEKVTNETSNSYEGIRQSPSFKLRQGIADILLENKKMIESFMPDSDILDGIGKAVEPHPLDRNIQVNFQGFDEDAIKLAMRALTLAKEFPDKKIALVAASGGGFSVEEAMAIIQQAAKQYPEMEKLAKNIVGGIGLGTPHFNLTPTAAPGTATQNLGYSDYFTAALGLPTVGISKNSKEYKAMLEHLPAGIKLPDDSIRPGENYAPVPGGAEHNIVKMIHFGFKEGSPLAKASPQVFSPDKFSFPKVAGSLGLFSMAEKFGGIEAALWHLSEKGPAHKWALDEAITLPLEKLEELVNTPPEKFDYANGIRLQQTWFTARENVIRGGTETPEGTQLISLLDEVGIQIEKLRSVGYKGGLFHVVSNETKPDTYSARQGGFLTRDDAQKWVETPGNVDNPDKNIALAEIKPDLGGVLENIAQIGKDSLLPEVIEKYNKMPSANPLQSQMKSVVGAFIDFQKKDLELYKAFLQDVLTLRKKIMNGDEQAKTDLSSLMESSVFSVIGKNYGNNDLVSDAASVLLQTDTIAKLTQKENSATIDGKELRLSAEKELFFDDKKIESFPFEIEAKSVTFKGKTTPIKTGSVMVSEKNRISAAVQDIDYATFPGLSLSGVEDIHKGTQALLSEYISAGGVITEDIKKKVAGLVGTYRFLSSSLNQLYKTLNNEPTPATPHQEYINNPVLFQEFLDKNKGKSFDELFEASQSIQPIQIPDLSVVSQEIEKVQQTVSTGVAGTIKKYLEDLGKEIYAVGLDKTLTPASAQEAVKRIDSALEGLKRLKDILPAKIPNRKGKLAPTGNVLGGYSSQLVQAKNKILEGNPQVPIDFKLGQLTKDIVAGLELTGADTGDLMEFADSITDPVTGRIKDNWEIHSPSQLMKYFKNMLIAGLEIGSQEQGKLKEIGNQFANSISGQIKNAVPGISQELQSIRNKLTGNITPDPSIERQQRKKLLINKLRIKGTPINPDLLQNAKAPPVQSGFNNLTPKANFLKGWANLKQNIKFLGQALQEEMQSVSEKRQEKSQEIWNSIYLTKTPYGQSRINQLRASLQMKGVTLPQQLAVPNSGFKAFSQQASQITNPQATPDIPKPSFDWMSPAILATQIGMIVAYKDTLIDIARVSIDVAKEFSVLTNTLNFLSGGIDKGTEKFNQLKEMSNEMGVNFKTVVQSYNQLASSTRNTSLEGGVTDDLIKGVAQAGVTFGLSSEEIQGSILAISQIAGKGVVSAEELRGQLAERIPGAFQIAARSMKMTEKELYQLMATGQMASTDFLPNFARQLSLETAGGVAGASGLATASLNKLGNSVESLQLKIGNALLPIYTLGVKLATVGVEFANSNLASIVRGMVTGFASLALASGQALSVLKGGLVGLAKWIGLSNLLGKAINMTKGAWIALGKSMAAMMAKSLAIYATIEIGIGIFKVFQAEFGKSTVYDQWANNIESNVDRVNEAIKSSANSMTQLSQVKPSNQIASSGNWWLEMGENALGLVGMDSRSQLDKAVKKANEKRAKEGKAPVSQEEIEAAIDARNNINRSQLGGGTRQRDKAIIEREKLSRIRDENFYNPIQQTMEQYRFGNSGPLAEIEKLEKKIKGLKAQQAVLDPADVETAQKLTKEIGLAEKAKQELLGPLDAQESGLRQALKDDQEKLDKYNQAILDQNSDDKEKRKAAEEFLRKPGHDPQSMEQVARDVDQTTAALNNYQREQARSGAFNDTKKLAMAMMELGYAFASVEKRINAIHIGKLKAISQMQIEGFSSDRFNGVNTGLQIAEENYNNTQRHLAERKATMQRLEADMALSPTKGAADQLIAAKEENLGREMTSEEINALAEVYAKEGQEQLKQSLLAEAALREERMKTGEMEKQSVEEQYAIREARQARYLAIYEDAMDEMKQLDQRALSAGMQGINNELIRNLQTDLGADDQFNVKASELQFANIKKQIENIPVALASLKQAYEQGDLSLEEYTVKSRALLTEDAQLKQQLAEQEVSHIRTVAQARMNALQRIKEERDANTEIANSDRTKAITQNSIGKFRTDEFLTNNESLAQAKNGLVEIQNQLENTRSELSELEAEYATGDLPLNDYIQKKRQILTTQAQQESQLATAEMARMRAIEDYRLAMLDRMRDVSNNKNAILNAEALTQLAQSQMSGQVSDSTINRQSAEIGLDNAKKAVEVAKDSLAQIQKAFAKKELSAEKYQERLRTINLEIAQANQSVAEQELAVLKANEQEKISIIEKSLEKQDRLNKLNAIKAKTNNTEQLSGMLVSGGTSDLTSSIFNNQETNTSQDQQITSLTSKLVGMKGILNPTKDLQDKILATEQELNEAVLTKRLALLSQSLEYKKQMLNATQLENKAIENQLNVIDSQHKIQQALVEITKKRLENEIVSMERVKTLSDEIGSSSIESVKSRSQFDDAITSKRLKTLGIELKANVRNLEIEQQREILGQRKAENESRLAVLQAKNTALIANQSGNSDAIALAQQQLSLANESLSVVLQQGHSMNQLHDTQRTKLALEHKGTLAAEKYAKIQDTINSKLKTANSYLDKQKERLDSINELNKAINSSRTNVLEKRGGIIDRGIDLFDQINGTEKVTDPTENPILMKELQEQLKANTGIDSLKNIDIKKMYSERLRLEETLANQKMDSLLAEQNMQKTLLQIEFDKLQLQGEALLLQAKMLALQAKGTENEADANQAVKDATSNLTGIADRRKSAESALGVNQSMERYNQEIDNANAINETRRRNAEAGYKPEGDPAKYPGTPRFAGKNVDELLAGEPKRFGYAPSFDLNRAVEAMFKGGSTDNLFRNIAQNVTPGKIDIANIPETQEATYQPLDLNNELLIDANDATRKNTTAMQDLITALKSVVVPEGQPSQNTTPKATPEYANGPAGPGRPTGPGTQQNTTNVNYGGVTIISSDPTGDARKVLTDLAKANKNRF